MKRLEGVETFRVLAIVAVIIIHVAPFKLSGADEFELNKYLFLFFNQVSRFAVPFFFVVAGYFWGLKCRNGAVLSASVSIVKRLFFLFVIWSVFYALPLDANHIYQHGIEATIQKQFEELSRLISSPWLLVLQGTKEHLWFLMSTLISVAISAFFIKYNQIILLSILAIALYLIGLSMKAYADTSFGIASEFNSRNGPFFSTLLFVTGYHLSSGIKQNCWLTWGVFSVLFGTLVHFVEIFIIWKVFATSPEQDFVVGTFFMGVGAAAIALSNPACIRQPYIAQFGKYTLGVYVLHIFILEQLQLVDLFVSGVFWSIVKVIIVFALSVLLVSFFL